MQAQLVSACTHFVFVCAISLGARNLEQRFANKRATSLPGDDETEYRMTNLKTLTPVHNRDDGRGGIWN